MLNWIRRFIAQMRGECPVCGVYTDDDVHGYNHRYEHCHNCGWCTFAQAHGKANCGVR